MPLHPRLALAVLLAAPGMMTTAAAMDSEAHFFESLPVVLSASRLPQALQDSPGAVTVIDADMIAATGYRDLARLFRLVPGMQVAQERGNQQWVTYHGLGADYPNQMQVLIDGRSVYSPHYSGGANWSALPVLLQDIERIEIVRGSNSATYGSNAFLGVVNIITRHTGTETGSSVSTRLGSHGIADLAGRAVLHDGPLGLRLSAEEQRDDGWSGLRDTQRLRRFNLRGDLALDTMNALQFSASYSDGRLGVGFRETLFDGSGERDLEQRDYTLHLGWRHTPNADEEWSLSWYRNGERTRDEWRVDSRANCVLPQICDFLALLPQLRGDVDNNRRSVRDNIELQHRFSPADGLRLLWGAEWREDRIESAFLFSDGRTPSQQEWRLFGNAEWRMAPEWLWNAGAMAEHIKDDKLRLAPRLFLNWQPAPATAWRVGYSRAWRQPTLYERWANVQVSTDVFGVVNQRHTPNSDIRPQQIDSWELGYLGPLPWGGLADVRVFDEHITDYIRRTPVLDPAPFVPSQALRDMLGGNPFLIHQIIGGHAVGQHAGQDPPDRHRIPADASPTGRHHPVADAHGHAAPRRRSGSTPQRCTLFGQPDLAAGDRRLAFGRNSPAHGPARGRHRLRAGPTLHRAGLHHARLEPGPQPARRRTAARGPGHGHEPARHPSGTGPQAAPGHATLRGQGCERDRTTGLRLAATAVLSGFAHLSANLIEKSFTGLSGCT